MGQAPNPVGLAKLVNFFLWYVQIALFSFYFSQLSKYTTIPIRFQAIRIPADINLGMDHVNFLTLN